ncbi:S8 family serine peptidase [Desulfofundulus thermobenzoicus]|nr:S8 family serine peptidase [Desulfofundulus thermobenzoicus]
MSGNLQAPSVAGHTYASKENVRQLIEERLQREKQMPPRDYSREIIVKWKKSADEVSKEALLNKCAAEKIHEKRDLSLLRVKDREKAIAELKRSGRVEFVEPNYPVQMLDVPNDPLFFEQWGLHTINAAKAWDKLAPNQDPVIVAVVDSGIDFYHEDLQGRISLDGAWDFVWNDNYPLDLDGHGTAVSGVIAAATGNATGIAGTAGRQNVQILPLRVFNLDGQADTYLVSQAIYHAVDCGAQVVNLSLGGPQYSQALADAVDYARERGVVVVAAAGNHEEGENDAVSYPAAFPGVIAVAASDGGDLVASFSNHGPEVMVAAPGVDILTTDIRYGGGGGGGGMTVLTTDVLYPNYTPVSGTSLATPFVSAAAAIIKSQLPGAGPDQVAEMIKKGVVDIGPPGRDDYAGYGRLDLDLVAAQLADAGTPGSGAVEMDPAQMLQIVFNQPVKIDGNTAAHFHLLTAAGAELPCTLYFVGEVNAGETGGYTTFWLKPRDALTAGQTYTLRVDAGLTAISGQKLAENYNLNIVVKAEEDNPVTPPSGDEGYSRTNPASIGTPLFARWNDYKGSHQAKIILVDIIRGEQAWQIIQEANSFNDPPQSGHEYILAKIKFEYLEGPDPDTQYHISGYDFTAVSEAGRDYEYCSVVEPEPDLDYRLYPGASCEGWAAYQVEVIDDKPLLTFGRDYDGKGGIWFKLYE